MTLEITKAQAHLLLTALGTRRQRIDNMVDICKDDPKTVAIYQKESLDVEILRQMIENTNNQ